MSLTVAEVAANLLDPAGAVQHPVDWCEERLGEHLWSLQAEVADSVYHHRRTAVQACFDVGKSFVASRLAGWWIDQHPPGTAFVVTTAPTGAQVRAILWREITGMHRKAKLPGRVNQTEWWLTPDGSTRRAPGAGEFLVAFGRKPSDTDTTAFQGIHERFVLVIIDEAAGVPTQLWDAAEGLIANEECRILAIGNPETPDSRFADVCAPGSAWNTIKISAFDSPNVTGERVPAEAAASLVSTTWIDERRDEWGEASPEWQAKVLGEFPKAGEHQLFPAELVRAAMERDMEKVGRHAALGVDVARFGRDRTVIAAAWGPVIEIVATYGHLRTTEVTGHVIRHYDDLDANVAKVDGVGVGAGVVDELEEARVPTVEMNAGGSPDDPDHFTMARDQWYWELRQALERGEVSLPEHHDLYRELTAMRWKPDSRGRVKVESKDEMKKRGLPSPDHADAVVMAFAEGGGWKPRAVAAAGETKAAGWKM